MVARVGRTESGVLRSLLRPLDYAVFIPALGIVAAAFFFAYAGTGGRLTVHLKGDDGEWVFPADAEETVRVAGPLGETVIVIGGGTAQVAASPCVNQLCVAAGAVRLRGQWAACLPNRVMLYVDGSGGVPGTVRRESNNETGVDAAAW
jgi:hypothetical protein